MWRLLLPSLACVALLSACAITDGEPWGIATVDATARFVDDDARYDAEGRIRTSNDYRVELESMSVHLGDISLFLAADGASIGFDPASPPAGYSLCHAGHCHRDDGALIDYAEIAAELSGGESMQPAVVIDADQSLEIERGEQQTTNNLCDAMPVGACDLSRGDLGSIALDVVAVSLSGRVFDSRVGDAARLPPEGVVFSFAIDETITFSTAIAGEIGNGEEVSVRLHPELAIGAGLFDGVNWVENANQESIDLMIDEVVEAFAAATTMTARVDR